MATLPGDEVAMTAGRISAVMPLLYIIATAARSSHMDFPSSTSLAREAALCMKKEPAASSTPVHQNTADRPSAVPTVPKTSGTRTCVVLLND